MTRIELLKAIIRKQDEYIILLRKELDEVATLAWIHGWRSSIVKEGELARKELSDLKKQLEKCPPETVTSRTIGSENNCNNCKWGICLTKDWPCNDCNGSNKWEPINE